jgi:hypothetical protein
MGPNRPRPTVPGTCMGPEQPGLRPTVPGSRGTRTAPDAPCTATARARPTVPSTRTFAPVPGSPRGPVSLDPGDHSTNPTPELDLVLAAGAGQEPVHELLDAEHAQVVAPVVDADQRVEAVGGRAGHGRGGHRLGGGRRPVVSRVRLGWPRPAAHARSTRPTGRDQSSRTTTTSRSWSASNQRAAAATASPALTAGASTVRPTTLSSNVWAVWRSRMVAAARRTGSPRARPGARAGTPGPGGPGAG